MKIHYLQHVPFEELGSSGSDLTTKEHQLASPQLYRKTTFPAIDTINWLFVMWKNKLTHNL